MLNSPTPFPYVGSYALIEHDGETTLARIVLRRWASQAPGVPAHEEIVIGLPLVDGASGNLRVDPARLIDASPPSGKELRDFHNLDRELAGIEARIRRWEASDPAVGGDGDRKPRLSQRQKAMAARRDALKARIVYGPLMDRLLRRARQREEYQRNAA